MRIKVERLCLVLPPVQSALDGPARCIWREVQGGWQSAILPDLEAVVQRYQARRIDVCPHPVDIAMAELELPPLSAKRCRIAVLGMLEQLALTPPERLAVGVGRRAANGRVPVAWCDRETLQRLMHRLRQQGLRPKGWYPPPAFLPYVNNDENPLATALLLDGWAVVRTGTNTGFLHPLIDPDADATQMMQCLGHRLPAGSVIREVAEALDMAGQASVQREETWRWQLSGADDAVAAVPAWLKPAVFWAAATTAVYLTGLNLYATQKAEEGRALNQRMVEQVKSAFPEIPIVINPLQQARQQRNARQSAGGVATADFPTLMRALTALLPPVQAQVQTLEYHDGQLHLRLRPGAALRREVRDSLLAQGKTRGLIISAEAHGIRVQLDTGVESTR